MKKVLLTLAVAAAFYACDNTPKYSISGKVDHLSGKIYLVTADNIPIDSAEVTDGKINLKGSVEEPVMAFLSTPEGGFARVVLENVPMTISGDLMDPAKIRVKGPGANDAYSAYLDRQARLEEQFYAPGTSDEQKTELIRQDSVAKAELVDGNRGNILGAFTFYSEVLYGLNGEQIEEEVAKFTPEMQQTVYLQKAREEAEKLKKTEIGQPYTDLTLPDAKGKEVALSSLVGKGKYVLLDFWASWCRPCMMEVPYLVDAYRKYHAKGFEIYGVSLDESKDDWTGAIQANKMDWTQVSTLQGWSSPAALQYGIKSIPSNLLIGPDGVILAKNLRGEQLAEKLERLLNNGK